MIEINGLTKVFGSFTAVNQLNLKINQGEIYGFLGPNGAGKTTTLLMMLGIIKPTAGTISVFGKSMQQNPFEIRRRIGVMAEALNFYDDMTAWEYLNYFAKLYDSKPNIPRINVLLERLNLWQWRNALIGGFSTGMRRKLAFTRALLHSPDLIILDEPVSGLDPFGIVQIRELILEEKKRGATVLISSHLLSEIEKTVDRVGIIARGNLVVEDCTEKIRQTMGNELYVEIETADYIPELAAKLTALPYIKSVDEKEKQVYCIMLVDESDQRAELGRQLLSMGIALKGMQVLENSLETAFITLTEKFVANLTDSTHGKDRS